MKKNIIVAALAAVAAMSSASAFAVDGQINFTGEIIDSACEVVNNVSAPLNVELGKVAKTAFSGAGDTASATKFTLQLKNCPVSVTGAAVKFEGAAAAGDNSVLALTQGAGVATGVGIQLSDASATALQLNTASATYPLVSTGVNNLDFVARYIATETEVGVGQANAVASFTINYN
ncbi:MULTISPECIES: fimbrial protein [unclassified Serratia (in: enterobacteria)]|uniref:fimbrial protein n=1 Tax=unclassified Serratia (in: enterobacteria) TaxID=2647522 RepID=UPI00050186EF|nr:MULTISPECIES: fimbrial protein [unclassified Serratia (in: enterobacteria)]KFK95216.1 ferrous iron transporter B [Serratia sp. Ag2]KFK96653.1 ferrous iron transporter B [Serratia sp. Ag1]